MVHSITLLILFHINYYIKVQHPKYFKINKNNIIKLRQRTYYLYFLSMTVSSELSHILEQIYLI